MNYKNDNLYKFFTHFKPLFFFYTLWNHKETRDFLLFLRDTEKNRGMKSVKEHSKVCFHRI